jgi:hypothetical protein
MNKTITLRQESNAQQLWALLKSNWRAFADAGRPLAVSITEAKSKRTIQQNKFHFARMTFLEENAWVNGQQFSKEAWHEFFADRYAAKKELRLPDGEIKLVRESTSDMDVDEFSTFCTKIDVYCAQELGIELE